MEKNDVASHHEDKLFPTIVTEYFDNEEEREAGWSINVTKQWIIVTQNHVSLPAQGWKLHISTGLSSAETILRRVLPVLRTEGACFKVAASLNILRSLNHGFAGVSQIGKFITVYPVDETQAVRLGLALDEVTRGLRGPAVPSDRLLQTDSRVSYRYGSYTHKMMYAPSGKVLSALTTPAGDLVPDLRQKAYTVPDWVQDPFIATGAANHQEKQSHLLIAGRYLQLASLYESPRGGTSLGIDVLRARSCMIKYAMHDAYLDMDGSDACDALRYEAHILERLAPDPTFPAVFDLVEQGSTLWMVMEEIQGEPLGKFADRLFAEGDLPVAQVVLWGRELAAILSKIHARGLVYHDLKPANVMVTRDKKLRLIDFELATEQGKKHTKSGIGTRGFMSLQHQAGQPAHITDDIYSLGALLYYLVTRANPSLAPDPSNLLQRPLTALNPVLGTGLVKVITQCLEPRAEQRFSSMGAVDAALASLEEVVIPDPDPSGEQAAYKGREVHYQALASKLGDTLCQTAIRQAGQPGVTWLSTVQLSDGMPLRAINTGCSGTILALAELVAELKVPAHRSILEEGVQWLLHTDSLIAGPLPGLYVGEAGVGAALLRVGQVLTDRTLIAAAEEKGRWIAQQPYHCQDLMNGAAGRLRFHLLLWDETHNPEQLQAAIEAGSWLIASAEDAGDGAMSWTLPTEFTGLTYLGYAHGAAGIADALLDLFEVTHDERFLAPVIGAYRLLERLAVPVLHDRSGLNWPLYAFDKKREMAGVYWCHGAAGIGRFLLHLKELDLAPHMGGLVRRAAWTVARGSRWTGPTQCHGLAGNIELLLDMFQSTNTQVYYAEAQSLARLLETFATEVDGLLVWPSDEPSCISPDYLVGYAGVLACLLRLAN
ncbi:MAG: lanthionine synthetase LanC family protein, partial [Ktedonobacteraceae bacterium]